MPLIWTDSDWSVAMATGQKRWLQPFSEVNSKFIFEQDYTQESASWTPGAMGLPYVGDASFFLVAESTPADLGGGLYRFTRTYSQLPASRILYESFAFTFPGFASGTLYALITIPSHTATNDSTGTTFTTATSSGYAVGDTVRVRYNAFDAFGNQTTRNLIRTIAAVSGTSMTVNLINDSYNAQPLYFMTVQKVDLGRNPITEVVASELRYDYFVGVEPRSILLFNKDIIIGDDGVQTDTYSDTTSPQTADYKALVADSEWIIAEDSILRNWKGPIVERVTRYVKAK